MTVKLENKHEGEMKKNLKRNKQEIYSAKLEIVFISFERDAPSYRADSTRPFNLISRTKEMSQIKFRRVSPLAFRVVYGFLKRF